jgi:hypothetical protein
MKRNLKNKLVLFAIFITLNLVLGMGCLTIEKSNDFHNNLITTSNLNNPLNTAADQVLIPGVPQHYQINNYYCGPAALEMIFSYYGPHISQDEIAEVARTYEPNSGTFWDELRRAGHFSDLSQSRGLEMPGSITGYTQRKIGYASFEANLNNASCLKDLIDLGYPILIITWSSEAHIYKHFRVVTGYNHQDGEILSFILNDPWIGPNYVMDFDYFVDLWSALSNWSLFVRPWSIQITYPTTVQINSNFTVEASIQYPCPIYFDPLDYPASNSEITINLPNGFLLSSGENKTKPLNSGIMHGRDSSTIQWNVTSGSNNIDGLISIEAYGKVSGSVAAHGLMVSYSYTDNIGVVKQIPIIITGGFPTEIVIIVSTASVGTIAIVAVILIRKRKGKRNLE